MKADASNTDCTGVNSTRIEEKDACNVDYQALTKECNENNYYGFTDGKPCILLKLNRVCVDKLSMWFC